MATDHLLEEILQSLLINNQSEHLDDHAGHLNNYLCRQSSEYLKKGFSGRRFDYKDVLIDELVMDWLDPLLENVKHLIHCNHLSLPSLRKEQIKVLEEKLIFIRYFLEIIGKDPETMNNIMPKQGLQHKTSEDLLTWVKILVEDAIYLTYELWIQREKFNRDLLFFDLLVKINHIVPEIRMIYAQFLNASKTANPGQLGTDLQALVSVDSLLGNLDELLKDQDDSSAIPLDAYQFAFLHQELSFLRYFLIMDPILKQYTEAEPESFNSLLMQLVEAMAGEAASLTHSISDGQKKDEMYKEMNLMHSNLLEIVNLLKAKIEQMYRRLPKPPASDFPWTPKLGFLDFFMQNLEELLKHRADSIAYVKNEIDTVQSELASLRSFMINNSEKDENIARRIMDVAHEAERVIDLILASHIPRWHYMLWLSDVIEKMKRLRKESTEVCRKEKGDISELNLERASVHDRPLPYSSLAPEDEVVGFSDQAGMIIDQLIGDSEKFDIVSIVGMPGLGKTTLARKVCKDPSVTRHFHVCCWYCISQEYRKRDLLLSILGDVTGDGERFQKMENEDMEEVLCKSLRGRRYLVVLDDIWSIKPWHDIQNSFPDDCNGSRVLFTTRNQAVALQANRRTCAPHDLRLFTDEESWELLQKKVFQGPDCPRELSPIGKKIAENCKGLPLSVVVVAGILKMMRESEDHWRQVSESLCKQVIRDSRGVIELSYKYLPDQLKPCFLYLGVFPEDKEISVSKLIQLWIAEGLVQKTVSGSMEKVAEDYLKDLIERSLVLLGKNKWNGGIKSCHLHDLLHEFSREKAKDEKFFLLSKYLVKLEELGDCLCCENDYFYEGMPDDSYVRSISCLPYDRSYLEVRSYILFSALPYIFKLLRVLDVEGFYLDKDLFPTEIILLVHLRYLSIGGAMTYVPSSIEKLWRLETFRFSVGYRVVKLPETLFKMAHLKHVHVNKRAAFALSDSFPLPEKSFESNIHNLSTLAFRHGNGTTEKILTCLKDLQKLKCIFLESWDSDRCCNRFPVLDLLSKLESLNVTYDGMVKHPCEFSFPSTLKKLTLSKFCLPWSEISEIGRLLPQLEALKLLFRACEGPRWDVSDDEFCNLKVLKLENLDIVEWDASDDAFLCLEKLVLRSCEQLKEVPSCFEALATLRMIEVQYCSYSAVTAVQKIQQEQEAIGNDGLKVIVQPRDWFSAPDS